MSFSINQGYIPPSVPVILDAIRVQVNLQFGTNYTPENFVGSNHYKFFYALAQRVQANEIKTAEIFQKLQQYFRLTNESIQRPVATSPGVIEALEREGFIASIKPNADVDAGKVFIAIDIDETAIDYPAKKLEICEIIKNSIAAGVVSQGLEIETIVLSNGQSFDFKYNLPNRIPVELKLTLTLSRNNMQFIESPEDVKSKLLQNLDQRYRLGRDFEPERYFSRDDAPWTSKVLLEWSDDDGVTWQGTPYLSAYDDLFTYGLESVLIVED